MYKRVEERDGKVYVNGRYLGEVLNELPEGWRYIEGAITAPRGYKWAWNVKSHFGGEYKQRLIRSIVQA